MKKIIIGALISGIVGLGHAQNAAIEMHGFDHYRIAPTWVQGDYLQNVGKGTESRRVKTLEQKASGYNFRESPFYDTRSSRVEVKFQREKDYILATYDRNGDLVKSYEEYRDLMLPLSVRNSIFKDYPGWKIDSDSYTVLYNRGKKAQRFYKVRMRKDHSRMHLKFHV